VNPGKHRLQPRTRQLFRLRVHKLRFIRHNSIFEYVTACVAK
jgi:hypothetical protein